MEISESQLTYLELASDLLNKLENGQISPSGSLGFTPVGCSISAATGSTFLAVAANFSVFNQLSQKNAGFTLTSKKSYRIDRNLLRFFVQRTATVFYSWQGWSPKETNRAFICEALQSAIGKVNPECGINLIIDSDTRGISGNVGFSDAILAKIKHAEIFVADLTAVGCSPNNQKIPNANVMFEYGYATATHDAERILIVLNSHFGKIEDIPSDTRHKMVIEYRCGPEYDHSERAQQKAKLEQKFIDQLRLIKDKLFPN